MLGCNKWSTVYLKGCWALADDLCGVSESPARLVLTLSCYHLHRKRMGLTFYDLSDSYSLILPLALVKEFYFFSWQIS
jgi:hypothetical protein